MRKELTMVQLPFSMLQFKISEKEVLLTNENNQFLKIFHVAEIRKHLLCKKQCKFQLNFEFKSANGKEDFVIYILMEVVPKFDGRDGIEILFREKRKIICSSMNFV